MCIPITRIVSINTFRIVLRLNQFSECFKAFNWDRNVNTIYWYPFINCSCRQNTIQWNNCKLIFFWSYTGWRLPLCMYDENSVTKQLQNNISCARGKLRIAKSKSMCQSYTNGRCDL